MEARKRRKTLTEIQKAQKVATAQIDPPTPLIPVQLIISPK
jgi:hypothetical protein